MTFDFIPTDDGLRIHDQIENVWTDIDAGGRVEPEPAETDRFIVPVDAAIRFDTAGLEFSTNFLVRVYDSERGVRGVVEDSECIPHEEFHEIDCTPQGMKAYVQVKHTSITIEVDQTTKLSFDSCISVLLGVRSHHERPAAVVTTTPEPSDLMKAISTFGSGLKTYSPERSFPTLRGHPPELAVKSSLQIPDTAIPPNTGVEVRVPSTIESIFTVAPLAFYLGATLVEDSTSEIHVAGESFAIDQPDLETGVRRTLEQCFTIDCLVRTVGLYPVELDELELVQEHVDLSPERLYDLPLDERTASYLSYPYDIFQGLLPWPTVTDVTPWTRNIELLPYLSYRLSAIRCPPVASSEKRIDHHHPSPRGRSPSGESTGFSDSLPVVTPASFDTHHNSWIGDAAPRSGTAPTLDSFITSLDETPRSGPIDIHVVCTDESMVAEVDSVYQGRSDQPFDISVSIGVSTDELESILCSGIDFLHFVGHTAPTGLKCTDGFLDLATLSSDRYPAFFLNGCQSYYQGRELARKGSVGGLVSLDSIENETAISAGRLIAQLLASGCTFSQTLVGLKRWSPLEYTAIGDGDHRLCTPVDYSPQVLTIDGESDDSEPCHVEIELLGETGTRLGTLVAPSFSDDASYRLRSEYTTTLSPDLISAIFEGFYPLSIGGELHWSSELDESKLWGLL